MEINMNFLEERILKDGLVKEGNVLKVDSFLNHQMDVKLLDRIGEEFYKRFSDTPITKILTIERPVLPLHTRWRVALTCRWSLRKNPKALISRATSIRRRLSPSLTRKRIRSSFRKSF